MTIKISILGPEPLDVTVAAIHSKFEQQVAMQLILFVIAANEDMQHAKLQNYFHSDALRSKTESSD